MYVFIYFCFVSYRPFTGVYTDNKEEGVYKCVVCGDVLFRSDEKFDSGSGWPSFYDVATKGNVKTNVDVSHGMVRKEVVCANVSFRNM